MSDGPARTKLAHMARCAAFCDSPHPELFWVQRRARHGAQRRVGRRVAGTGARWNLRGFVRRRDTGAGRLWQRRGATFRRHRSASICWSRAIKSGLRLRRLRCCALPDAPPKPNSRPIKSKFICASIRCSICRARRPKPCKKFCLMASLLNFTGPPLRRAFPSTSISKR